MNQIEQLRQEVAQRERWLSEPRDEISRAWEATTHCRKLTAAQEREAEAASKRIHAWNRNERARRMAGIRKNPPKPPAAKRNQPTATKATINYRPPRGGRRRTNDAIFGKHNFPAAYVP